MKYQLTGTLEAVGQIETRGNFSFREFVVSYEDNGYKQDVKFQLTAKMLDVLNKIECGSMQESGRVFNNLTAWRVVELESARPSQQSYGKQAQSSEIMDEDVPF